MNDTTALLALDATLQRLLGQLEDSRAPFAWKIVRGYASELCEHYKALQKIAAFAPEQVVEPCLWIRNDEYAHAVGSAYMCHIKGTKPAESGWLPLFSPFCPPPPADATKAAIIAAYKQGACDFAGEGYGPPNDKELDKCANEYAETVAERPADAADTQQHGGDAVEKVAALLHEEATDEPWTITGRGAAVAVRDYYRDLARRVIALTANQEPKG